MFESSVYLINHIPTLVLQNHFHFECLFNCTLDYDFLHAFRFLCFPSLRLYHAHKLDFHSSPCVFLGYSSSHLSYRCHDLAFQCIYVSYHVRFHENVFLFANSKQIAPPTSTSTQPTHLLTLITFPVFHPADPPITPPSGFTTLLAPQTQLPRSPPLSATIPPSHNHALMSPSACFSNDHYAGTSSPSSELHFSRSVTTANPDSTTSSPSFVAANSNSLAHPSPDLQLFVDLSSYSL